jgi:small subunit ribosomal protein S3
VEIEKIRDQLRSSSEGVHHRGGGDPSSETDAQLVARAWPPSSSAAWPSAAHERTVSIARKFGAEGIKISAAGRLAGAEIARSEWYRDGRVPLQTLRADIDFGYAIAKTTYGVIG